MVRARISYGTGLAGSDNCDTVWGDRVVSPVDGRMTWSAPGDVLGWPPCDPMMQGELPATRTEGIWRHHNYNGETARPTIYL